MIRSINPTAKIQSCVRGAVPDPLTLMGSGGGEGAASWGILDEHRQLVASVQEQEKERQEQTRKETSAECHDATCSDPTHDHDHGHSHDVSCADTTCTDPSHHHDHSPSSHSHSYDHAHSTEIACSDSTCKDPTHNHDHSHSHNDHDDHDPSTCTDPTHNHDHSHSHSHSHGSSDETTAAQRFGITSFVYKRRRPFHPLRFTRFLQGLGKLSVEGIAQISNGPSQFASPELTRAQRALLRSKGFVWMATSGAAAYFMSHAGQYLDLVVLGRWWADIDRKDWPAGLEDEITLDFDPNDSKFGDRRQELVFIGQFDEGNASGSGSGAANSRKAMEAVLDSCLLTDEEMKEYERIAPKGDGALRDHFVP